MKSVLRGSLAVALGSLPMFFAGTLAWAQFPSQSPLRPATDLFSLSTVGDRMIDPEIRLASAIEPWSRSGHHCSDPGCRRCRPVSSVCVANRGFYAGAEYLLMRPHFSEAIAFAQGTLAPSLQITGRELQFDYDSSVRAFIGYRLGDGGEEIRFTYWHLGGDIAASGTAGAGQFIVDPFGNNVGLLPIIDPGDARFTAPPGLTFLPGGDLIRTKATVQMNVFDVDFVSPIVLKNRRWAVNWSAGVRFADIDQYYESVITDGGAFFSKGDFFADFIGVGPRLGFEARRHFGQRGRFSLFINGHGSLLLGEESIRSSNTVTLPFPFAASQQENLTRISPVVETELGASCKIGNSLNVSLGWSFQAWFDMGTSGGQFGGFFGGADDSNIMSFDGMSAKAKWTF